MTRFPIALLAVFVALAALAVTTTGNAGQRQLTPPFPASGDFVTNTSGRTVLIALRELQPPIYGVFIDNKGDNNYSNTFTLEPGGTIELTYADGAVTSWHWYTLEQ